jgi:DNA-binding beta-propeller fold protein YncE
MTQVRYGVATLAAIAVLAAVGASTFAAHADEETSVGGTMWAANRGNNDIAGFDTDTGALVAKIAMASGSEPGDLAYANGKLYVAEESGPAPSVAVVDLTTRTVKIRIGFPVGSRPHHVHASESGALVAVGLYGTDTVGVIDTFSDTLIGQWDSNPNTTNGRAHAASFSDDESTLYVASDASNEVTAIDPRTGTFFWSLTVPAAHELAVTRDQKWLYVTRRTANRIALVRLHNDPTVQPAGFTDVITVGLPDTLQLAANDEVLTIGLRTRPAQLAVVDTHKFGVTLVNLTALSELSIAGHQWTSPGGRYTFVTWEGGTAPNQGGITVVDHAAGNQIVRTISYPTRPHGIERAP